MREIKITSGGAPDHVRAIVGGMSSSGKTTFAATAPRPLFVSDYAEGGYKSITQMDPALWWDPKHSPDVWAIENMADIPQMLSRLEQLAVGGKFPYRTIIVDPISIYVDRVLAELMLKSPGQDTRRYYGDLANHLRVLVLRFHALPCHVLWLCHVKEDGMLAIGGQMGTKLPAFMDFKWLTWVHTQPNQPPVYELHTAPFRNFTFVSGRWLMPDPLIPSFKCISQILKLKERPVSPAVAGYPDGVEYDWPPAK